MSDSITQEQAGRPFEERVMSLLLDMHEQVGQLREQVVQLNERVAGLEAKQYDTKPIWERALNEIMELRREMAEVRQEMHEQRLRTERGFTNFERKLDVFIQDFIDMRDKLRYMENRFQEMDKRTV